MSHLGVKKLYALLDVPAEEREKFIESKHVVNDTEKTVSEMTTRELQKVIAEKKAIESHLSGLEDELFRKDNLIIQLKNKPPERVIEYRDKVLSQPKIEIQHTKNLDTLTAEILIYKEQVGVGIIEIGKRLIEAKKLVGHGNWLNYLKEKVDFTQKTATKFMRIAESYPNLKSTSDLKVEKLYMLLDVPTEEREEFIESKHVINDTEKTVSEMTTRELQKVIAEKKAIENHLSGLEDELFRKDNLIIQLKNKPPERVIEYRDNPEHLNRLQSKENEIRNLSTNLRNMESELQRLKTLENKQSEIEKMYKQLEELKEKKSMAIKQLDDNMKIFGSIDRIKKTIKDEVLYIPTLTVHYSEICNNRLF